MPPRVDTHVKPQYLSTRFVTLASSQHFWWFIGQCCILLFTFVHTVVSTFYGRSAYYNAGLLAILVTYAIVIFQVHFKGQRPASIISASRHARFWATIFKDDNVLYFILAWIFYVTRNINGQVSGALHPYALYALFHAASFTQHQLLPSLPLDFERKQRIVSMISQLETNFRDRAMSLASACELRVLVMQIVSALISTLSVLRAPWYAATTTVVAVCIFLFVTSRYLASGHMKLTVHALDTTTMKYLSLAPPGMLRVYETGFKPRIRHFVQIVSTMVDSTDKKSR